MWSINKKQEVGYMRKKTILLVLSLFIGINVFIGSICMFIDKTGGILIYKINRFVDFKIKGSEKSDRD